VLLVDPAFDEQERPLPWHDNRPEWHV